MCNNAIPNGPPLRSRVMAMRGAGMSQPEIAARLGVALELVQSEVDGFTREDGARLAHELSSLQVVAEARERFAFQIAAIEREVGKLDRTPGSSTALKLKCVALLADLNERNQRFAYAVGLLNPITPKAVGSVEDATTIRAALRAAGALDPDDLISDGERAWLGMPPTGSRDGYEVNRYAE